MSTGLTTDSTMLSAPRSIEGNVILKRKSLYVKRYAKVENNIFLYKKEKSNTKIQLICYRRF